MPCQCCAWVTGLGTRGEACSSSFGRKSLLFFLMPEFGSGQTANAMVAIKQMPSVSFSSPKQKQNCIKRSAVKISDDDRQWPTRYQVSESPDVPVRVTWKHGRVLRRPFFTADIWISSSWKSTNGTNNINGGSVSHDSMHNTRVLKQRELNGIPSLSTLNPTLSI